MGVPQTSTVQYVTYTFLSRSTQRAVLKRDLVKQADGSAYIEFNKTKLTCSVFGPKQNRKNEFLSSARIQCEFKFSTFSSTAKRGHQRDSQEYEFSNFVSRAVSSSCRLDLYPKSVIEVYVMVLESDGVCATLSAAIIAASVALADAGIAMTDLVVATSFCRVKGEVLTDCTASEEAEADLQLVVAKLACSDQITHVHHSGIFCDMATIKKMLQDASDLCNKLYVVVKNSISD